MDLLSRTRSELTLGAWALSPVVAFVALWLHWMHHAAAQSDYLARQDWSYQPVTTWMLLELVGLIVLAIVVMGLLLRDLSRRDVPDRLRKVWMAFIILGAPFGGLGYWLLHCHGSGAGVPAGDAT
jgi:hypothetical protein